MKKLLYLLLLTPIIYLTSCSKSGDITPNNNTNSSIYTYVPDDNFEIALINLGLDNTLNDTVLTTAIDTVIILNLNIQNIADLTGIEDFVALTNLGCGGNQLTSIDVSNNTALTFLNCGYNQLTSLDVSQNTNLTDLHCNDNQLTSLDVSQNTNLTDLHCNDNQLTSLDVSGATALITLYCPDNQLTSLSLSQNTSLIDFNCNFNQLTRLDVRNGNNVNLGTGAYDLVFTNNPNLYCIDVDDANYSTANWSGQDYIDNQSFFSEDCGVK